MQTNIGKRRSESYWVFVSSIRAGPNRDRGISSNTSRSVCKSSNKSILGCMCLRVSKGIHGLDVQLSGHCIADGTQNSPLSIGATCNSWKCYYWLELKRKGSRVINNIPTFSIPLVEVTVAAYLQRLAYATIEGWPCTGLPVDAISWYMLNKMDQGRLKSCRKHLQHHSKWEGKSIKIVNVIREINYLEPTWVAINFNFGS